MKVHKRELEANLTRDQSYLVSCWHNMVHEQSTESHRVRIAAPEYMLAEYMKMVESKRTKAPERKQVRLELLDVLKADPVLAAAPYALPVGRLIKILSDPAGDKEDGFGPTGTMVKYLVAEINALLKVYPTEVLNHLRAIVVDGAAANVTEPKRFREIATCTNNLLSTLLIRGVGLQSLFHLYQRTLLNAPMDFSRRWDTVADILTRGRMRQVHIVITLDNVTAPDDIPKHIGGINFLREPPFTPPVSDRSAKAEALLGYLTPHRSRLFASMMVNTADTRAAGGEALDQLNRVVNLLRFEFETAKLTIADFFAYQDGAKPVKALSFPSTIPNPSSLMDGAGVSAFVEAVDELVSRGQFNDEGLDRIHSAFRLYRTGLDTNVLENKLTNWWTALEYLVRGATEDSSIGQSVETLVTPVLGLAYLQKHLVVFRNVLLDLKVVLTQPPSGEVIELRGMDPLALYRLFKDAAVTQQIDAALASHPYVQTHIKEFVPLLQDLKKWHVQTTNHERRVRWHLQRLWRTRCDIVHSAGRQQGLILLCANLESYLKTVLVSLLRDVRQVPTLSGPKEFFDREQHSYAELMADLKEGNEQVLVRVLSTT